jgi:hypothetical protein
MKPKIIFTKWRIKRKASAFPKLKNKKKNLLKLFEICNANNFLFPINNDSIVTGLKLIDDFIIEDKYQKQFIVLIEKSILPISKSKQIWYKWIDYYRKKCILIDTISPEISMAIERVLDSDIINDIPDILYNHLLDSYREKYDKLLTTKGELSQNEFDKLFLSYSALVGMRGETKQSEKIFKDWLSKNKTRPRALDNFSDQEAYNAALKGVGSPNGVCITSFHDTLNNHPQKITCAGSTGDKVLNSLISSALYAAALSCNQEPTFVLSGSSLLSISIDINERDDELCRHGDLLPAVLTPTGLTEPKKDLPTLGMELDEAMLLVSKLFDELRDYTGLVQVHRRSLDRFNSLAERIIELFKNNTQEFYELKSDPSTIDNLGAIDIIPYFFRNSEGKIDAITIKVPFSIINYENVYELMNYVRKEHVERLIEAGKRRKMYAYKVFREHSDRVEMWKQLPVKKKQLCKNQFIEIDGYYDFKLGITRKYSKIKKISRYEYEETQRPGIKQDALLYHNKFEKLCNKLQELNKEGGKADILALKLLMDSMLRQAPIEMDNTAFQKAYKEWKTNTLVSVWAIIQNWAKDNDVLEDDLAADNIAFNTEILKSENSVLIKPMIVLDMNDFIAHIDTKKGRVKIKPALKMPKLSDILIQNKTLGIDDVENLHSKFIEWLQNCFKSDKREELENTKKHVLHSKGEKHYLVIQIEIAKQDIIKGKIKRAMETLENLKKHDIASIYFWAAVAYQCKYLNDTQFLRNRIKNLISPQRSYLYEPESNQSKAELAKVIYSLSCQMLIEHIKLKQNIITDKARDLNRLFLSENKAQKLKHDTNVFVSSQLSESRVISNMDARSLGERYFKKLVNSLQPELPIDEKASKFLQQLNAKNSQFVEKLVEDNRIEHIEDADLKVTIKDMREIENALAALSSLELLNLAEKMRDLTSEISFEGDDTRSVKINIINKVIMQLDSICLYPPTCEDQIYDLQKAL